MFVVQYKDVVLMATLGSLSLAAFQRPAPSPSSEIWYDAAPNLPILCTHTSPNYKVRCVLGGLLGAVCGLLYP